MQNCNEIPFISSILRTCVKDFPKVKSKLNPSLFILEKIQKPKEKRTTVTPTEIHNSLLKGHQIAPILGNGKAFFVTNPTLVMNEW